MLPNTNQTRRLDVFAVVALAAFGHQALTGPAAAEPIVQTLAGSWGGAGRISYADAPARESAATPIIAEAAANTA